MKKLFSLIVLFLAFSAVKLQAQDKFSNWPALADFHTVMSATFHPAEKGNYTPVKTRAVEMATKAKTLSRSIIPEGYNQTQLKKVMKQLVTETSSLQKLIKKKSSDTLINRSLIRVHDTFHQIVGLCKDEGH